MRRGGAKVSCYGEVLRGAGRSPPASATQALATAAAAVQVSVTYRYIPLHTAAVQVSERLLKLGERSEHRELFDMREELVIDALACAIDLAVPPFSLAIEVDGPTHFLHFEDGTREHNGATAYKHRLLRALGWRVVSIPYYEYQPLHSAQQSEYVRAKLAHLLQPDPSQPLPPALPAPPGMQAGGEPHALQPAEDNGGSWLRPLVGGPSSIGCLASQVGGPGALAAGGPGALAVGGPGALRARTPTPPLLGGVPPDPRLRCWSSFQLQGDGDPRNDDPRLRGGSERAHTAAQARVDEIDL